MKITKILLFILIIAVSLSAQHKFSDFKVGLLMPSDAKSGFLGGINLGRSIDENVGTSIGIDIYRRSYTKETKIAEESIGEGEFSEIARELDQSITLIPVYFQLHYVGGLSRALQLRLSGGVGYELLWNNITNYETEEDKTQFFHGFGWNVSGGISFPLSRASDVFGEIVYHSGKPSRDAGETEAGLPVRSEIDMSGIGFRFGVRIYGFGF
jgi:hypothetical protein